MTPREALQRMIENDARNIRDVKRFRLCDQHARVIADCAVRYLQARGPEHDIEIEEVALANLRRATEGWRA
jgi:hypothetical protein